ncbi:MAG: tRNA uridine-5-carboxymethylaminomethyl(34) synthesis GTPase MnmE [Porcipelethomonas sp.]
MSTIAAIATPDAPGGISVIRISGNDAFVISDRIFRSFAGKTVQDMEGYTCAYGNIVDADEVVDDVVLTVFRAPKSYTGENVAEISCHGGRYITRKILRLILKNGAEPAGAGEFTKRAFLNGKMSLTQAEAVMDVISSAGEIELRYANALKDGAVFRRINGLKNDLVKILADLAAWADFPEEDVPEVRPEVLLSELEELSQKFAKLAATYDSGRIIRDGINTVIVGRPNAGKSTLMNCLSGFQRSIVTDIEGTTRDVIEESIKLGDFTLRLSDTAGIRSTDDVIENMGVEIAFSRMKEADLIFAVFDSSRELSDEDKRIISNIDLSKSVAIINKIDADSKIDRDYIYSIFKYVAEISAKNEDGIEKIEKILEEMFEHNDKPENGFIANERQKNCLERAAEYVIEAKTALESGVLLDGITVLLDSASEKLMELTGEKVSEAVVDDVFSRFCVGK